MAENKIKTRLQLKHDTYANWENVKDTFKPLPGEICIAEIPTGNSEATTAPTVLFKVGAYKAGSNTELCTFGELKWASALAADVHAWAKKSEEDFKTWLPTLIPVEVVDNGSGKFVTGVTATTKDGKHVITITRANVAWEDVTDKPDLVNSVKTTDDDVVILTPVNAETGDVTITGAHKKYDGAGYINEENQEINTPGQEYTITIPKLTVDEYGHTTYDGDTTHTIKIPDEVAVNDGKLTLKTGNGMATIAPVEFSANASANKEFTVAHADTSSVQNVTKTDRTYISGITFDDFGHVLSVQTGSEADQDLSGYKTKQTAKEGTLTGAEVLGSWAQNENGELTITARTLTAADLGLDTVMHFIGAFAAAPTKAFAGTDDERDLANGDVYLNTTNGTEYVYSAGNWVELGNEGAAGSHALKTITISAGDGLTGGGSLEENRTIAHATPEGAKADTHGSSEARTYLKAVTTDKFGHVTGIETGTETVSQGIVNITASGDSEIGLAFTDYEDYTGVLTAAHTAHAAGSAKTDSTKTINGYNGTGTINIPKIVTNAYGHVTEISEEQVTITMPAEQDLSDYVTTEQLNTAVEAVAKDAADQATVVLSEAQKYADEKVGALTTDDIAPGTQVWIFDCGSATEVV